METKYYDYVVGTEDETGDFVFACTPAFTGIDTGDMFTTEDGKLYTVKSSITDTMTSETIKFVSSVLGDPQKITTIFDKKDVTEG